MYCRRVYSTLNTKYDISTIKNIISTVKGKTSLTESTKENSQKPSIKVPRIKTPKVIKTKTIPLSINLFEKYNGELYSVSDINKCNKFFNGANVTFERSAVNSIEFENPMNTLLDDPIDGIDQPKLRNTIKILPEIAFLGSSNAGKSSLLNALLTKYNKASTESIARTSHKAGYTKYLNFFNISNKFRLVDTPGYGYNSTNVQGELTRQYLLNRKELLRSYILIPAKKLPNHRDLSVMNFLNENGISYDVIFTKMDELKNTEELERSIKEFIYGSSRVKPNIFFVNSITNKYCEHRYGFDKLRMSIINITNTSIK
ncbi:hypothetical protein TPHA_0H01550 [Tetrapisispora phaffii CBS 4417]|uniref:EngB-type G domain-containing protein n=1 Tax=Tetrapisispora phaffii (strain ATCC 24235 / CBS 4417 / NBRC 1672 / NRRL Y-8282 / UCD 70-5) TaxID=1071381 RepID=G8BX57_TETPH|nr:hypothetical protein TPHA_0H01550 [Tetrapisispora phaffii CBS 4417]CCE64361.1 hypothetical protein TPHA_0H01550 [Tetrapisispora phaffii CBS 4417]